ncbi:hypothetical protein [Pseudonocardia nigra]|uniref:hypothetical protein n=1 Tax=Pseudonocardia nigra TaxID=1921578 RepID=UPI001C5FBB91|nr:hypothetical protein [Pseudonocardia nigra]
MTDRRSYEGRVQDGYYVYGLVDPRALLETDDDPLLSIFYVGKGRGARWAFHEKDVHTALMREQERLGGDPRRQSGSARSSTEDSRSPHYGSRPATSTSRTPTSPRPSPSTWWAPLSRQPDVHR